MTLSLGQSFLVKGNAIWIITSIKTILNPMHETRKMFDVTETKSNVSLRLHSLGELFHYVPYILLNEIMEVLIVHQTGFDETLTFHWNMEANDVQEKVHALERDVTHWSNCWLKECHWIIANVGVNDFHDGT